MARITKLPYYQMGMRLLKQQYEEGENFAAFRQWVGQEENRDLVELLGDAVSTEIFCYGAGNWVDFVDLWQQVSRGMQLAPYTQLLKDPKSKDPKAMQYASGRAVLRVLARNPNKIKIPDFIIGFKIKDARKAEAQIKRLETVLKDLAAVQPMLQDRVKRVKVGESSFLSLSFDGSMIPWDEIDWKDVEEAAGEFDGVRKNLKKLKLTINLGVRGDYLLLSIGSTTEGIKQLGGEGPRLTSLAELKPLVRAAGKRLTGISYSSKVLAAKSKMSADDIDNLATMAGHALDAAGIPENKRKAIMKDVSGLAGDLKKELTPAGASLSFSYLSERGYEGYDYQYGEFPYLDSSKPLTLLNHVGGDPILAVVGRSKGTLERVSNDVEMDQDRFRPRRAVDLGHPARSASRHVDRNGGSGALSVHATGGLVLGSAAQVALLPAGRCVRPRRPAGSPAPASRAGGGAMKWALAAIALVVVANGVVLVSAGRERAAPASRTTIDVCAGHLIGGGTSDEPPGLKLEIAPESLSIPAGLDAPGLRALSFAEALIAAVGRDRDSTFRWPRSRPAWVRLRQRSDSLQLLAVAQVAPLRDRLARDSASIVVRGLVGIRERRSGPQPGPPSGHDHAAMDRLRAPGVLYPAVLELIPAQLHLDRRQMATLRSTLADTAGCARKRQAVIANGANGGIWVEAVR